ncbi:MAG: type II toxin-antitoxin system RelB/DinJ family antitoxin [Acetobacteraceae bacterium]
MLCQIPGEASPQTDEASAGVPTISASRRATSVSVGTPGARAVAANALVRARIDQTVKKRATAVLGDMGLTISDAVRIRDCQGRRPALLRGGRSGRA